MRKLYIPQLKDELELAADWQFPLHEEYRNLKLIQLIDPSYSGRGWPKYDTLTGSYATRIWNVGLPAGTKLIVDRVYIRAGGEDFSSLTFRAVFKGKKVRFWAKLADVNTIVLV